MVLFFQSHMSLAGFLIQPEINSLKAVEGGALILDHPVYIQSAHLLDTSYTIDVDLGTWRSFESRMSVARIGHTCGVFKDVKNNKEDKVVVSGGSEQERRFSTGCIKKRGFRVGQK